MRERRALEDLKFAYPLCWPTCFSSRLGWWVPRKSLLGLENGIVGWGGKRWEEKVYVICWRWGQRGKGGHSSAEGKTGERIWFGEERQRRSAFSLLIPSMSGLWVPRGHLLELGVGIKQQVWGRKIGREDLCNPLEMGLGEGRAESRKGSVTDLLMKPGGLNLGKKESEDPKLAYLLP